MSKSSRVPWSGGRSGRHGPRDIAIIDVAHTMSARRRAKIAFWVLLFTVGSAVGVVASAIVGLLLGVVIGALVGLAVAGLVGGLIFIWPVLRVIWHWSAELLAFGLGLAFYLALVQVMPYWAALVVLVLAFAGPFGYPGTRRVLLAWIWCAIYRHRLRLCFAAFIASNRFGTVPLILWAKPTRAGARVTVWLRPGLALGDLESRRDKLAVACWAKDVRVSPASRTRAALVTVDITRRNPLAAAVDSPLPDLIAGIQFPADAPVSPAVPPVTALNLPDVPETEDDATDRLDSRRRLRVAEPASQPADAPETPDDNAGTGDDPNDWI